MFGCGAILGPLITGGLGDRIGFAAALRLPLAVQAVASARRRSAPARRA
jgi:hypothetical protein